MNIFILDKNARIAAQYHCDKHVVKMVLESCQILCSVYHDKASHLAIPYKLTHKNHPSCIWARSSLGNFDWLLQHTRALFEEYTKRYGKIHKSQTVLEWCESNKDSLVFHKTELQPFAIAIGDDKQCRSRIINFDEKDAVEKYRLYYVFDKPFAVWDNAATPEWFTELKHKYKLTGS